MNILNKKFTFKQLFEDAPTMKEGGTIQVGDRVKNKKGRAGTVTAYTPGGIVRVQFDDSSRGATLTTERELTKISDAKQRMKHGAQIKKGIRVKIPYSLTTDPYNKRGEIGTVLKFDEKNDTVTVLFDDGIKGLYQESAVENMNTPLTKQQEKDLINDIQFMGDVDFVPAHKEEYMRILDKKAREAALYTLKHRERNFERLAKARKKHYE